MKRVSILIHPEFLPASIVGPIDVFAAVNSYEGAEAKGPFFDVRLIGTTTREVRIGSITFHCDALIDEVQETDMILIPAVADNMEACLSSCAEWYPWLSRMHLVHGAEVVSFCKGAFVLASSGLLNGKTATTHWAGMDDFKIMFPEVKLKPEALITEHSGIYTSGGATSYMNMLLYLVEKYCGRDVSLWASKIFLVDLNPGKQDQFVIFNRQKNHADQQIRKAQEYIEAHFDKPLSISALANYVQVSRRSFVRRFKKATRNTPLQYIQRVKIEAAKQALEQSNATISRVMSDVGYQDEKSFRNLFKKLTGITPAEYRRKYQRFRVYSN